MSILEFCFEAADQLMHEATIQSSVGDFLHCRDTRTYYYTDRIILYCISFLPLFNECTRECVKYPGVLKIQV